MFSKKATKIDELFTVDLTYCRKHQIDGEHFVDFCSLLRKLELYETAIIQNLADKCICHTYTRECIMFVTFWSVWCKTAQAEVGVSLP